MSFRDKLFRVGDRVMQTRNNYDVLWEDDETDEADVPEPEDVSPGRGRARPPQVAGREWDEEPESERGGVFNGDIGVIVDIDVPERTMRVRFDDRVAIYTSDMLDDLEHAWAVTVHKSRERVSLCHHADVQCLDPASDAEPAVYGSDTCPAHGDSGRARICDPDDGGE